jgi:hypothetical protein
MNARSFFAPRIRGIASSILRRRAVRASARETAKPALVAHLLGLGTGAAAITGLTPIIAALLRALIQ